MSLMTRLLWVALIGLALLLVGCSTLTGDSEIEQLETQSAQLQGTIQVMGTPMLTIAALEQAATQNVVFQAQLTESAVDLLEAQSTLTVLELGGGVPVAGVPAAATQAAPAAPPGDQPASVPTPAPSVTQSATSFSGTVIATSLDEFDCPVTSSSAIDYSTDEIFVDTRINLLPAGSQISARWYVNDELYFDDVECWIPQQEWQDICAYCSIVPDSGTFPLGEWSVELYLDGQLMSQTRFSTFDPATEAGNASGTGATE